MADLQQTIGAVIRRERQARRLTMKALAERAALSEVYLSEIERGKKYPSAPVLEKLAEALDLAVSDLIELVADELRLASQPERVRAIGFAPVHSGQPRSPAERPAGTRGSLDAVMLAGIAGFFPTRRNGSAA
jgi:transcriptional regulator with XRE-family HTH domain